MAIRNEFEDKTNLSSNELSGREDTILLAQATGTEGQNNEAPANQQVAQPQNAEPAAAPKVTLVEIEDGSIARLPEGASVDQPRMNGTDLEFVQADGSIIVIPNGAIQGLTLFIGNVEIPPQTVAALFEANAIQPAAGPDGGAAGAPGSSGGNFEHGVPGIGDGLAFSALLGPTELAFGEPGFELADSENFVPLFGSAFLTLNGVSDEGLSEGNIDSFGSSDTTNSATSSGTLDVSDRDGDFLNFTMGAPAAALTSSGVAIVWDVSGENILVGRAANAEIIRITVTEGRTADGGGNYVVELKGPIDHPNDARPGGEDDLSINIPISVSDGHGGSATATLVLTIEDDSPVLTEAAPASEGEGGQLAQPLRSVAVDEDGLSQGNGNNDSAGDHIAHSASATGELGIAWGADKGDTNDATLELGGFAQDAVDGQLAGRAVYFASDIVTVTGAAGGLPSEGSEGVASASNALYSNGQLVTIEVSEDGSKLIGVVKGETSDSDGPVFEVTLSDDGSGKFNFQLLGQLDHAPGGSENDITLTFDFTARDFDGDTVDGHFVVTIDDDMPIRNAGEERPAVQGQVQEDGMGPLPAGDNDGQTGNQEPGVPSSDQTSGASGSLMSLVKVGADGPGKFGISLDAANLPTLYSHGQPVTYHVSADGHTLTATWGGTNPVFTLTVGEDGSWTFDLDDQLDHASGNGENFDLCTGQGSVGAIDFSSIITVTDQDGDTLVGLNQGAFTIVVEDDVPVLESASGVNLLTNGDFLQGAGDFPNQYDWGNSDGGIDADGIAGWTMAASNVEGAASPQLERVGNGYLGMTTHNGAPMLDMAASPGNMEISQTVAGLTAGQTYTIQFEAGAPFPDTASLEVYWGTTLIATVEAGKAMALYSFPVTAAGDATDKLTFKEVGLDDPAFSGEATAGHHGTYLANVSLVQAAVVDEDGLPDGNHDNALGDAPGNDTTVFGHLGIKWGADAVDDAADTNGLQDTPHGLGDRSVTFQSETVEVAGINGALKSNGHDVTFSWNADHTVLTGSANGHDIIKVELTDDADGGFRFTLLDQLDHTPGGNENDLSLTFNFTATDSDGDSSSGKFTVIIDDDMPKLTGASPELRAVYENDIDTDWSQGTSPSDGNNEGGVGKGSLTEGSTGAAYISGSLAGLVNFGADGAAASNGFSFTADWQTYLTSLHLFSKETALPENGQELVYTRNGNVITAYEPDTHGSGNTSNKVFSLTLNADGSYEFRLYDELIHKAGKGGNTQLRSGNDGSVVEGIDFGKIIKATDGDGDSVTLDGKFVVKVVDDVPEAHISLKSGTVQVDESGSNDSSGDDNTSSSSVRDQFEALEEAHPNQEGDDPHVGGDNNGWTSGNGAIAYARSASAIVDTDIVVGADSPALSSKLSLGLFSANGQAVSSLGSGLFTTGGNAITLELWNGLIVGRVQPGGSNASGVVAFAVAIDSDGRVSVAQYLSLRHPDASNSDEGIALDLGHVVGGTVRAVVSVTDSDGDTTTDSVSIGGKITFDDDAPSVDSNDKVVLEDDDLPNGIDGGVADDSAPQNASGTLSHDYGADGAGTTLLTGVSLPANAGFTSAITNGGLTLIISQNGVDVLRVQLTDATSGKYTVTQLHAIDHPTGNNENNVDFTIKYQAKDGDGDTRNGSLSLTVDDDSPDLDLSLKQGVKIIIDETDGVSASGETDPAGGNLGKVTVSAATLFNEDADFGADGAATANAKSFALSINGGDGTASGFVDAQTNQSIVLVNNAGTIEGRVGGNGGAVAFTVSVNSSGAVTLTQIRAIEHNNTGDTDELSGGMNANKMHLTETITDQDGDKDSATIDLGSIIRFEDDGPSVSPNAQVSLDDDNRPTGNNDNALGDNLAPLNTSGTLAHNYGSDGAGTTLLTGVSVPSNNGFSSAISNNGKTLIISQNGTQVIKVELNDSTSGNYTVTQLSAIKHPDGNTENNVDFTINYQVKDADSDSKNGTLSLTVDDDMPVGSSYTGNTFAEGSGGHDVGVATALLGYKAGADGLQSLTFATGDKGGSLSINGNGHLIYTAPAHVSSGSTVTETFSYTVTDKDGDIVTKQITFGVSDTGVTMGVAPANLIIDEDNIPGANGNDGVPQPVGDATPVTTGHLSYTLGADALQSVALSVASTGLSKLDGTLVNTTWNAATNTLIGYGTSPADVVFTITLSGVNSTGADYTIVLEQPVMHPGHDNPSTGGTVETTYEDNLGFVVTATVTDADGSQGTASFTVTVNDDSVRLDDYALHPTVAEGSGAHDLGLAVDLLGIQPGADGLQSLTFTAGDKGGSLSVDGNGHLIYTAPAQVSSGGTVLETIHYTLTDKDGDSVTRTATLNVSDTGVTMGAAPANLVVDEDDIGINGNAGGPGDATPSTTGHLSYGLGADGLHSVKLSVASTGLTKLDGTPVSTVWDAATKTLIGYGTSTADVVFTITLTNVGATGADYTVVLAQPVTHPGHDADGANNGFETSYEDNLGFTVTATVTDADGSTGAANFTVSIDDDSPTAANDVWNPQITGATVLTGLLNNDALGADGVDSDNNPTTGQVVVSTQAAHGTVVYNNDGTFTYTPNAGYNGSDSFAYTIKDADGDTSTATVTLNDIHTNSVPSAGTTTATVDDEGLANGNAGGVNDVTAGAPESVATGILPHDFNTDGKAATDPISFATMNGMGGTVGTEAVTYTWSSATNSLTASSARGAVFTVNVDGNSDNGAGNYTVTLLKPILHALGANENNANVDLTYTVKDGNNETVNGTLTVTFNDDTPIAEANTVTVTAGTINEVDVVLIVDVSSSMDDDYINVPGSDLSNDRIGLARYSMLQMLNNNTQIENVMIVQFAGSADDGVWMTRANAIAFLNDDDNWDLHSSTDYDSGLQAAINGFNTARPLGVSPETVVYFLSDGEPSSGGGINDTGNNGNVSIAEWEAFVTTPANHISEVYAVGIGPDVSSSALSPISYPNIDGPDAGTVEDHVILVPNQNDVAGFVATLQESIGVASSVTGNILVDDPSTTTGADSFGADGGYIKSITIGAVVYTFDGTGTVAESSATPPGYADHGTWIEVPTALGGMLTFYFATTGVHAAGSWSYLAPTNAGGAESIAYTLIDGDGDTVSSSLGITVIEPNDAPAGTSSSVTILEDSSLVLSAAHFGFTDPNDSPANALMNVVITDISGAGKLMNNGVQVLAGAIISASDVTDGGLQFIPDDDANGTATISFKVQDNGGTANGGVDTDQSANTLTINITAQNDAPEITSNGGGDTAAISVAENNTAVTTVTSTDVDASATKTYAFAGGADDALFNINSATGVLTFKNAPNYEVPTDTDGNNVYNVKVKVTDNGGLMDVQSLTVAVTNVNEAPTILSPDGLVYDPGTDDKTAFNRIAFADRDTTGNVTVTFARTSGDGTLAASSGAGVTVGGSSSALTLTGTIAAINAFIAASLVTLNTQGNDTDKFTISINDGTSATSKTDFSVSDSSFSASNGTNNNDYAGVNVYELTLNSGNGSDTTTTSWNNLGSAATSYEGGSGTDTINLTFTAGQLQDILSNATSRDDLQGFLSNPLGNTLALGSTTWHASASGFETANIDLANLFSDAAAASINATWKSVIAGSETVGMSGTGSDNLVIANADGTVSGNGGNDVLVARDSGNTLDGGAGSDFLIGGDGNDILIGGSGTDVLAGGAGADTFKSSGTTVDALDVIADYSFAEGDKVDLSSLLDANFGPSGNPNDFVKLVASGDNVTVQVDANGGANSFQDAFTVIGVNSAGAHDPIKIIFDGHEYTFTI